MTGDGKIGAGVIRGRAPQRGGRGAGRPQSGKNGWPGAATVERGERREYKKKKEKEERRRRGRAARQVRAGWAGGENREGALAPTLARRRPRAHHSLARRLTASTLRLA